MSSSSDLTPPARDTSPDPGTGPDEGDAWRAHGTSGHAVYEELAASSDFHELRRRYRAFAIPWTVAFLAWYLLYVLMSNYATGFMDTKVVGEINVALVFGVLQFVSTFAIAFLYSRHAAHHLDPLADRVRARYDEVLGGGDLEGGAR